MTVDNPSENQKEVDNILVLNGADLRLSRISDWHPQSGEIARSLRQVSKEYLSHARFQPDASAEVKYTGWIQQIIEELYRVTDHTYEIYSELSPPTATHVFSDSKTNMEKPKIETCFQRGQFQVNAPSFAVYNPNYYRSLPVEETIWFVVKTHGSFQLDNLYTNMEDVAISLLSILLQNNPTTDYFFEENELLKAVEQYHEKLFANYKKWCLHLNVEPFPWCEKPWSLTSDFRENDKLRQSKLMFEIAVFRMIYVESANLRHTPEMLCWFFHWILLDWRHRNFFQESFIETITDCVQKIRDQQWEFGNKLDPPDHTGKLNYDDFNELFWAKECLTLILDEKTPLNSPEVLVSRPLHMSRKNLNTVLDKLLLVGVYKGAVKTFPEHRSYIQVLRCVWRILTFHVVWFFATLTVRSVMDYSDYKYKYWGLSLISLPILSCISIFLDLLLMDFRVLFRGNNFQIKVLPKVIPYSISIALTIVSCFYVSKYGIETSYLHPSKPLALMILAFYGGRFLFPFMFLKASASKLPANPNSHLSKLSSFIAGGRYSGTTAQLQYEWYTVLHYIIFWLFVLSVKMLFWLFVLLPPVLRASSMIPLVTWKPFYIFGSAAFFGDSNKVLLKSLLWLPVVAVWIFDLQIFFLLIGSIYGTLIGHFRNVGYAKRLKLIQKHFFHTISKSPFFTNKTCLRDSVCQDIRIIKPSDDRSQMIDQSLSKRANLQNKTISFGVGVIREKAVFRSADVAEERKFAFTWNEIVHSWRQEDIISNSEYMLLEFNEIPTIEYLGWEEVKLGKCHINWSTSQMRVPIMMMKTNLCNLASQFETHELRLSNPGRNMKKKLSLSAKFLNHIKANETNYSNLKEIYEALCLFFVRYNTYGGQLVESIIDLVSWIIDDGRNLYYIDLKKVFELITLLQPIFAVCGQVAKFTPENYNTLRSTLAKIKPFMLNIIRTKNSDNNNSTIRNYIDCVNLCYSVPFQSDIPPVDAPGVTPKELHEIVGSLLYDYHRRSSMSNNPNLPMPTTGSLPMSLSRITTLRGLGKILCMKYLYNVTSPNFFSEEHPWILENAIRMRFRRVARLINYRGQGLAVKEASRRLKHFVGTMYMDMAENPMVNKMYGLCTLVPYYREDAMLELSDLEKPTSEGVTKMELLRSLHVEEFSNFLERTDRRGDMFRIHQELESRVAEECDAEKAAAVNEARHQLEQTGLLHRYDKFIDNLQTWASMRGQVLGRTVRGFMYITQGIKIKSYLEFLDRIHLNIDWNRLDEMQANILKDSDSALWWNIICPEPPYENFSESNVGAKLKHTLLIGAQEFGKDRIENCGKSLQRKNAILGFLEMYPTLRVCTIERDKDTGIRYSVLYRIKQKRVSVGDTEIHDFVLARKNLETRIRKTQFKRSVAMIPDESALNEGDDKISDDHKNSSSTRGFQDPNVEAIRIAQNRKNVIKKTDSPIIRLSSLFQSENLLQSIPPDDKNNSYKEQLIDDSTINYSDQPQHNNDNINNENENINNNNNSNNDNNNSNDNLSPKSIISSPLQTPTSHQNNSPTDLNIDDIYDPLQLASLWESEALATAANNPKVGRLAPGRLKPFEGIVGETCPVKRETPAVLAPPPLPRLAELQELYRIALPRIVNSKGLPCDRYPIIGPGKPENQNVCVIYARGSKLQTIDMNMDGYLEESIKMGVLLEEFRRVPNLRILGFREHIFTQNVSSLAGFMALQENLFTTTSQRFYDDPLRVRMHYGHPDIFDRSFVETMGSCSKASNGINLSEDIFAGYNATSRGYRSLQTDFIQCGKGRDVGLQQICLFEKKVASGNAEQLLSRDLQRLMSSADFFRTLSMYYTGVGFFLNSVLLILGAYITLYSKAFIALEEYSHNGAMDSHLESVLAPVTFFQFQLGLLLIIPLVLFVILEKGVNEAWNVFLNMFFKLGILYYNFMVLTKAAVVDQVLMYGGAKYHETGRGFVIAHAGFVSLWQSYYNSHFQKALEFIFLLSIYGLFAGCTAAVYLLDSWPFWLMALSFLWVPIIFNPLGLYYYRLCNDLREFRLWFRSRDLTSPDASWLSWYYHEMYWRGGVSWHQRIFLLIKNCRFILLGVAMLSAASSKTGLSDFELILYVCAGSGWVWGLVLLSEDLQLGSPLLASLAKTVCGLFFFGVTLWALVDRYTSFINLCLIFVSVWILIYGTLEFILACTPRWAARNAVVVSTMKVYHRAAGLLVFLPAVLLAAFTLSFNKLQNRILFNSDFIEIVKSGLGQSRDVRKRGL